MHIFAISAVNVIKGIFQETVEFDLLFEKVYKWNASSVEDRNTFITCLWKVSVYPF